MPMILRTVEIGTKYPNSDYSKRPEHTVKVTFQHGKHSYDTIVVELGVAETIELFGTAAEMALKQLAFDADDLALMVAGDPEVPAAEGEAAERAS